LLEEILRAVGEQFCFKDIEDRIVAIKDWVVGEFEKFIDTFATEATAHEIDMKLGGFDGSYNKPDDLKNAFGDLINNLNVDALLEEKIKFAQELIESQDYNGIIKFFNHKALVNQIGKFFDIKPSAYKQKVLDIMLTGNEIIINSIRNSLPNIVPD